MDSADYVLWRKSLGQSGTGLVADGDGDHTITQADYDIWRAHFGEFLGGGSSLNSESVPEPTAATLLILGACGLLGRSRKRRVI